MIHSRPQTSIDVKTQHIWALVLLGAVLVCCSDDDHQVAPGDSTAFTTPGENPLCAAFEPNNTPPQATPITHPSAPLEARICAADQDWFTFSAQAMDILTARIEFRHTQGDLDLFLYDANLRELARSESSDDDEFVQFTFARSGRYLLQVFGYEGERADYNLATTVSLTPGGDCDDDPFEDNDTQLDAATISGGTLEGFMCTGDDDYFTLQAPAGTVIGATLLFGHAEGDLDMQLLDAAGDVLAESASANDNEALRHKVDQEGAYTVRIFGYEGASNTYQLGLELEGLPVSEGDDTITGTIRFDDPVLDFESGAVSTTPAPLPGATVEVIDRNTGAVLGGGVTNTAGRYTARYDGSEASAVAVRVLARVRGDAAVDVVDRDRQVYAAVFDAGLVPPAEQSAQILDIDIPSEDGASAPFNALEAARRGLVWWGERSGFAEAPPLLHIVWQPDRQLSCGTCYLHDESPSTIYLLGLAEDNDALDDPVVLHEVGHFIQNHLSWDDSPGGSHDGTPTDPRLAYAEGWATFFSSMVRDDAAYYDTLGGWYILQNIEELDPDFGVFGGQRMDDNISEYLVAALMWDIYDPVSAGDAVALGIGAVDPLLDYLRDGAPSLRGVEGVDLVDYLDGLYCAEPGARASVGGLLEEVGFPYDGAAPDACKPGAPIQITMTPDPVRPGIFWPAVSASRPMDAAFLLYCRARGQCETLASSDGLAPGEVMIANEPRGESLGGYLEARMQRGSAVWTKVRVLRATPEPNSGPWRQGSPSQEGGGVIEVRLGTR